MHALIFLTNYQLDWSKRVWPYGDLRVTHFHLTTFLGGHITLTFLVVDQMLLSLTPKLDCFLEKNSYPIFHLPNSFQRLTFSGVLNTPIPPPPVAHFQPPPSYTHFDKIKRKINSNEERMINANMEKMIRMMIE